MNSYNGISTDYKGLFPVRITAKNVPATGVFVNRPVYSWIEQTRTVTGAYTDEAQARRGTYTAIDDMQNPLLDPNNTEYGVGQILWIRESVAVKGITTYEVVGPGARSLFVGKFYSSGPTTISGRTLDAGNNWVDTAFHSGWNGTSRPVEIDNGFLFSASPDATFLAWPEPSFPGKMAYLPIQYATHQYPGYVSILAQEFAGAKTFRDNVLVGIPGAPGTSRSLTVYGPISTTAAGTNGSIAAGGTLTGNTSGSVQSSWSCGALYAGALHVTDPQMFKVQDVGSIDGYPFAFEGSGRRVSFKVNTDVYPGDISTAPRLTFNNTFPITIDGLRRIVALYGVFGEVKATNTVTSDQMFAGTGATSGGSGSGGILSNLYGAYREYANFAALPTPSTGSGMAWNYGATKIEEKNGTNYVMFLNGLYIGGTGTPGTPGLLTTNSTGAGGSSELTSVLTGMGGVSGTFNSGAF